jgi:hypothetical protein
MFKSKDDIVIERKEYGVYNAELSLINNNNVNIKNMIKIDFMKIIYELNKDLIDEIKLNKIDNDNGECYLKLRHLFEDLGFPQFFTTLNIKFHRKGDEIIVKVKTADVDISIEKNDELVEGPIFDTECKLTCISESNLRVNVLLKMEWNNIPITDFLEKICMKLTKKIIKRLKEFVYKLIIRDEV